MTPERWLRAKDIFCKALERDQREREPYLARTCGDDQELLDEVRNLLRANEKLGADALIEKPIVPIEDKATVDLQTDDLIGQFFGPYKIIDELGRGGMGAVYLAERADGVFDKKVAVKLIKADADPHLIHRFEQERKILAKLEHQNIARLIEAGTAPNGTHFFVMEYAEGQNLRQILKQEGALPLDKVIKIAGQVCAALIEAHQAGIVHRDIKPENLIINEKAGALRVKVLDFGIAKLLMPNAPLTQTRAGTPIGTPAYMSPEQIIGDDNHPVDLRSDVYSLGMVVYEMLAGQRAFEGEAWVVLNKHLNEEPKPPNRIKAGLNIPKEIEQEVLKALKKDRQARHQSATEFAERLEWAYQRAEPENPLAVIKKRMPVLIPVVAVLSLLVAFVVTFSNFPPFSESPHPEEKKIAAAIDNRLLISLRVMKKIGDGEEQTLSSDNMVKIGEQIRFEVNLHQPGKVYLLDATEGENLEWWNPFREDSAPDRKEGWKKIPAGHWVPAIPPARPHYFWLIYAPEGVDWSLSKEILPHALMVKEEPNEPLAIPAAASARLRSFLEQRTVMMNITQVGAENMITHQFSSAGAMNRVASYRLKLEQR